MAHGERGQPPEQPVLMYQSAGKIYPRDVRGIFDRLRKAAMIVLLGLFYAGPWLRIGDTPLLLIDLPARRFHVFGMTLMPQDLYLLAALLLLAALTLFFFTSLAGRLWCGYACPQTVWTELFLWVERRFEGDRHERMKLDRAPWSANKLARKAGKHGAWALLALFTGFSFVGYFVPAPQLAHELLTASVGGWALFWVLFYAFATWGNAGFLREQVCKYMCPYARFQSAMFDRDTLIIAYDARRGEPRKTLARKTGVAAAGCVDCSLCVQACPVGIDIRQGLQYECIACAACIDACDGVMQKIGQPRGLIRYSSARRDAGGHFRFLRPRVLGYGAVWLAVLLATVTLIVTRAPFGIDIIRDRKQLYRELADGSIENVYALKLSNKDAQAHRYLIEARFADGRVVQLEPHSVEAAAGEHLSLTVAARAGDQHATVDKLQFTVTQQGETPLQQRRVASFLSDGAVQGPQAE